MLSLIKYNLDYYEKSFKYIIPGLFYIVFIAINYQTTSPVWSTYFIAALGTFVFANFIATSFMTCEDITQQGITRLHIRNDTAFHLAKIISLLLIMLVACVLVVLFPVAIGFFARSLTVTEIFVALVIHLMLSLLGTAVGIFFTIDSFLIHATVILFSVMPLAAMFESPWIIGASYLLPPVNFLAEDMHYLSDQKLMPSYSLLVFFLYSLGYSLLLFGIYILKERRKRK
ncbi:MAG: hypothetical protein FWB80_00655 [Defluviitaleaceae bacterium]|nr:hypothetical protein [Defluviitaleaceae bacterium]